MAYTAIHFLRPSFRMTRLVRVWPPLLPREGDVDGLFTATYRIILNQKLDVGPIPPRDVCVATYLRYGYPLEVSFEHF